MVWLIPSVDWNPRKISDFAGVIIVFVAAATAANCAGKDIHHGMEFGMTPIAVV